MTRSGFTIVEIIITIAIMGILLTLAVVGVNGTQMNARDTERKGDIESIQMALESYYGSGGVNIDTAAVVIQNLALNPSLREGTTTWSFSSTGGASGTNTRELTDGPSVSSTFYRRTTSAEVTTSPIAAAMGGTGVSAIPVSSNTTYTISGYMRTTQALTSGLRIDITTYDASGTQLVSSTGTINPNGLTQQVNTWQRIYRTYTTPANTAYMRVGYIFSGPTGAPSGSTFDVTGAMITEGSTLYDYADGTSTGWIWNGVANGSASSGPSLTLKEPGTYPNTDLVEPGRPKAYLPDIDLKSLTAPGESESTVSLIAATNTNETPEGVLPQPQVNQYVYQPIDDNGDLCTSGGCRKYNLYYRLESDNTIYKIMSKYQ